MSKLMYDSTSPNLIPTDAPVVAGYADGRYQWSSADWARFPNSIAVSIACFPQSQADILDIETGCAAPEDVPGWLDRYNRPVFKVPTLYVNRANWTAVRAAVGSQQVDYWVATLDGTQVVPGAAAVQYTDTGAYDISLCQDYWPRMPPSPRPQEEIRMILLRDSTSGAIYFVNGSQVVHLTAQGDVLALQAAGLKQEDVSSGFIAALQAFVPQGKVAGTLNVSGTLTVS